MRINTNTPADMLCATGNRPLYFEVQPWLEHETVADGLPSHPLDAPAFAHAGAACKYDDGTPMPRIVILDGRMV